MSFIVTPISTVTTGAPATSTWANSVKTELDWLTSQNKATSSRPYAILVQNTVQSIPNAAWTSLTMDTETWDVGNGHTGTSANYTTVATGLYLVVGSCNFATNTTGDRNIRVLNGAIGYGQVSVRAANANTCITTTALVACNAGDVLALQAFQDSGGALSTTLATSAPTFSVYWLNS